MHVDAYMHISFMLESDVGSLTLTCAETGEMIRLPVKLDYCGRYNGVFVSACPSVSLTVSIYFLCQLRRDVYIWL